MSNYPTLRLGVLQGIAALKASVDADPGVLRRPECPYDNDTIDLLEKLFKPVEVERIVEVEVTKPQRGKVGRPRKNAGGEVTDDDAAELEEEAKACLTELRAMGRTMEGEMKSLDTKTKLDIIRAKTTLMEKLVSIRERFSSVREVAGFQQTVISILDDLIPEERRDEFLKRLEGYRS